MRRLGLVFFLCLLVFVTAGWNAAGFEVGFVAGASQTAGGESELVFTLPSPGGQRHFEIDMTASGFTVRGVPVVAIEGWPDRQMVAATVTDKGGIVSVVLNEETKAWNLYITVPVQNPAKAQPVPGSAFKVRSGKDATALEPRTTQTSALVIRYDVSPTVSFLPAGGHGAVEFEIREGDKLVTEDLGFRMRWNKTVVLTGTTRSGKVAANLAYVLEKNRHAGAVTLDVWNVKTPAIVSSGLVPIRYNFAISGTEGLKIGAEVTITGRVTDANGNGVANVTVSLTTAGFGGSSTSSTRTDAKGSFALSYRFSTADKYSVLVGEATYHTFLVTGGTMEVKVQPGELVSSSTEMKIQLSSLHDGKALSDVEYRVEGPGGVLVKDWEKSGSWGSTITVLNLGKNLPAGTYKVLARWDESLWSTAETIYDRTGEATFSVRASKVEAKIGRVDTGGKVSVGSNWVQVKVTDVKGAGVKKEPEPEQIGRVYFKVTGPLTELATFDSAADGAAFDDEGKTTKTTHFRVEQWGQMSVTGRVEFGNGRIEHFAYTYEIDGWLVATKQVLGEYGETVEMRAEVRTALGVLVNNAVVTWKATGDAFMVRRPDGTWGDPTNIVQVDGVLDNLNDGVYAREVRLVRADQNVEILVTHWGSNLARASFPARILGKKDFTVTVTAPELMATVATQPVRITVRDMTGAHVTNLDSLQVRGSGVEISLANSHLVDSTGDGKSDSYMIYVSPATAGDIHVKVGRYNHSIFGEATLSVRMPTTIMEPANGIITAHIWDRITVMSSDVTPGGVPRTMRMRLTPVNAAMTLRNPAAGVVPAIEVRNPVTLWASELQAVDVKARATGNDVPYIVVSVSYSGEHWVDIGTLAVESLQAEIQPSELLFGVQTVVRVFVRDARGTPLAARRVDFVGVSAVTAMDGAATFHIATQVTGNIPLTVTTDTDGSPYVMYVPSLLDNEPPQLSVSVPPLVWSDKLVIKGTFSDNHRVSRVIIDGLAEIPIVPDAGWFEYEFSLRKGVNNITVVAVDPTGNFTRRHVRVFYAEQLVLRIGEAYSELGLNEPLQQVGGRIMVPLRWYAEHVLGGAITYRVSNGTELYGLSHHNTVLEFTPNSRTAYVNGWSIAIDPCYISQGRLYVPLRFLAEHTGLKVQWDNVIQSVIIRP